MDIEEVLVPNFVDRAQVVEQEVSMGGKGL